LAERPEVTDGGGAALAFEGEEADAGDGEEGGEPGGGGGFFVVDDGVDDGDDDDGEGADEGGFGGLRGLEADGLGDVARGDPQSYLDPSPHHWPRRLVEERAEGQGGEGKTDGGDDGDVHVSFIQVFDGPEISPVHDRHRGEHDFKGRVVPSPILPSFPRVHHPPAAPQARPDLSEAAGNGLDPRGGSGGEEGGREGGREGGDVG